MARKSNKKSIRNWGCSILLIILAVAGACGWLGWRYVTTTYNGPDVWLHIPRNSTLQAVTDSLIARLGSDTGLKVNNILTHMRRNSAIPTGTYLIHSGDKALDIARTLQRRAQTPVKVTFNNIRTMPQLADRISQLMDFDAADFLAAADTILPAAGFDRPELYPAAFLPDTYEFYWTTPAPEVITRLLSYHNRFWDDGRINRANALHLNPSQVATLASIVEEETNYAPERSTVARLYLNRLQRGMLLQADPTVKYAVGDFTLRRILGKHLTVDSPYNTYRYAGLPPGPIRIPSKQSIDAVLQAPDAPYLYMCAKEDFSGRHNFAVTFNEHRANAARYQRELNRRNIK
ncbi:MAG: endolytic transglycosylase MltG [Muribaculaceae bacterium]|nr:endolytic transglycosylase MltG [Muribaculaceae bacterium]